MSRPDGSIIQGYLTQECISFCENFLYGADQPPGVSVGLPVNKHDGRLEGEGHCNSRRELHVAYSDRRSDFDRANLVGLQHLDEVDPFVALHKEIIANKYRDRGVCRTDAEVTREQNSTSCIGSKSILLLIPRRRALRTDCSYTPWHMAPRPTSQPIRHMISTDTRSTRRPKISYA